MVPNLTARRMAYPHITPKEGSHMDVARRLKFGLVALGAVLVSAFTAAPALADTQPDPT
ncbi:MAG: hypothetical protein H0U03_06585, partial [Actinobacteria bacterium]|nr:hypothetical protein [Actinomycetota bacterium]